MSRLNNRAFQILRAEVKNCSANDPLSQTEQEIVLRRLERLRLQKGSPASLDEMREAVIDMFPQFSQKALKEAARANRPPGVFSKIKWTAILLTGSAGALWVVNLPYPMIRWPIAKTAPILLLPSYMSMDHHYRQAIAQVEQADQLVNKATSPADFELGAEKVKQAQKHLDALPVWFLGYWPQYTFWFGWQFTLDEFKSARATVGRMEAQLFQENQAQTLLTQGEESLNTAKQQYQQAQTTTDREKAIASWQTFLDQMDQLPQETLAGKAAQTKLQAYKRDFEKVASTADRNARTGTLIAAAQEFALSAEKAAQQPPQTAAQWQQVEKLWEEAIDRLKEVPLQDPGYLEAQKLLASYQTNLGMVQTKRQSVGSAVDSARSGTLIEGAKQFAFAAAKAGQNPPHTAEQWQQIDNLWEKAINQLQTIRVEDSGYLEAQKLLASYQTNLGIVQTRLKAERDSREALTEAKQEIQSLIASIPSDSSQVNRNQIVSQMQGIINQLQTVKPGTTAYKESQQLLQSAHKKLKQL
ncbi:hypothetical protein NDI44_15475 [Trichocoleus sp. DQ-A3]|uniref:hypothetical protein n=1 Tax=Cyanophyceae TaxID=3028117 RepID=UPI001681DFA1|nr:hypothetical protein [Coleofasciculus sp. FACHB-125]MBD1900209.1 hypothetical protein [Coleofasciculus sp. FACHB-125]